MAPNVDRDPILEAYHLWNENGWEDCAAGCTAVTSLMRVHQMMTKRADQILAPLDLTFARYELLVRLYFHTGRCRSTSSARQLQIHQTSITSLVDRLEKQGLIKRTPHPTDRRSTIAQMTPAGRVLTGKAINLLNAEFFRDLGLSEREAHLLIGLLMKMRRSWNDIENPEAGSRSRSAWTPVASQNYTDRSVQFRGVCYCGRMPERIEVPDEFPLVGDVSGKRVVITGAGRGLGEPPSAHALSQGGARVALVARTAGDLAAVADALPGPSLVFAGDVTDQEFNEAVADADRGRMGRRRRLDLQRGDLAHRGRAAARPIPSVWREILDVNLTGAFLGARAAARVMRDGGRTDLHRLGARGAAARRARRVQRVEGRPRRHGEGPRARPRAVGHHRERRRAGLVRLAAGRAVEEQPRARSRRPRPHRANALGRARPTWPARTSSSPPTRRRSSPAPCSTSTAGTCSYERARTRTREGEDARRSSRSRVRAERSAPRCRRQFAGEPDTDVVLSDVSDAVARRRPSTGCRERRARSRRCSPTSSDFAEVEAVVALRGRALRPPRRADQQRRRALAERPHPQPRRPRTGSGRSGSTCSARSTASGPRCRSCARSGRGRSSSPRRSPGSPRGRTRRRTARRRRR